MAYSHPGATTPVHARYSLSHTGVADRRGRPGVDRAVGYLALATAVIGVATYGVSVVPPAHPGWAVRFSVLAGVVAALTALPSDAPRQWVVVTLAAAGFLDGTATLIEADRPGWVPIVIVVLGGMQTAVAIAGIALDVRRKTSTTAAAVPDDPNQAYYAAYQAYIAATRQVAPRGHWGDSGRAEAAAQAQPSPEAMLSHYRRYIAFADQQQGTTRPSAAHTGHVNTGTAAPTGPAAEPHHNAVDPAGYRERHAADPNA
ncbi:DUF5336 domain-containing protein [Mycolicibacterium sp. CBMA 226]|uniref:DUF5336 domain-containing protein n=1 Tax=Mycolicibacterium sp. CBMA 226 TaxID=2606611 RepID=UPI0012DDB70F|nr:DUF5336 domain-containing protein [Mycolicibacterium sp. CBMA 226]MUL78857.1 hypothetical protein [Mycolicibacterium sp. CBMA 226]QGW61154.1 hypothetical protein ICEMyc226_00122 [Mycolicibacterium sp.]